MSFREKPFALLLLLLVVLVQAWAMWPEISVSRSDLNDNVLHFTLIERIVDAVQHGRNPLDSWSPEISLGFPVLRDYQPLPHLMVAGAWFALGKSVSLMTVFVWVRFLSVVLLPVTFYAAARLLGLPLASSIASAALAPLVSTEYLYGIESNSYLWAGTGLFTQAVSMHFLLLAIGTGYRAIQHGKRLLLAGVMVGLTLISHLIYGWMAALTLLLLAALPDPAPRLLRFGRTIAIGIVAFLISAFQIVPLLTDGAVINHSRWEAPWKWDSFGAETALIRLVTGELLDHGRLPVLTALAFGGAALLVWNLRRGRKSEVHIFIAAGAAFWVLMYFGRPFWGPLLTVLGASEDLHLHRVIGGAQIFLVLLAGIGLEWMWRTLSARRLAIVAAAATAVLLYPMIQERRQFLTNDSVWGRRNLDAHAAVEPDIDAALAQIKARGGRAYAGLAATWGARFKVGDVPVYAHFPPAGIPSVGYLYHAMALTGDIMVRFNETIPAQYRLFNIQSVVTPAGTSFPSAPFLTRRETYGPLQVYDAPGGGYFDLVDAFVAVKTDKRNFYDVNDRWLQSDWLSKRTYLLLDWNGGIPAGTLRFDPDAALPPLTSEPPIAGAIVKEEQNGQDYGATVVSVRPLYVLFKMTWHPKWKAYVDGVAQPVSILSPGFPAVHIGAGPHRVEFRYEPGPWKLVLAFAGVFLVTIVGLWGRRLAPAVELVRNASTRWPAIPSAAWTAAGLLLLALPVSMPLFTGSVIYGHDAFCYFPRLVEVHQNLVHGVLLPRWAPDLGRGYGQPLFVFHPPFFYWLAEIWHLTGFDYVTAVNLACVLIVVVSGAAMYLLGKLYFGRPGGWLAAASYLYIPYFAVDLYVRSSLEEFTAFALVPLTLYGFGAYARSARRRYWILGALSYAALLFCHFPAALLFTPLIIGFLAVISWMAKSWRLLAIQAAGVLLGLAIGAASWYPALAEKQFVLIDRAVQGTGQYASHFVYLQQLFYSAWGYGYSVPGPNDGMSFMIGRSHLFLAIFACVWVSRHPKLADLRLIRYFAAAGILLCILMLQDSIWFWEHLPLLSYVQLPWRLLQPVAVCASILIAALAPAIRSLERRRAWALAAALTLLVAPNLSHLAAGKKAEVDLEFWTPRQLAARGFETTTFGEVTPRWMTPVPPFTPKAAEVLEGVAQIRDLSRTPFSWSGQVTALVPSRVRVEEAYYPGWTAQIDGSPAEITPGVGAGTIDLTVPPGSHEVDVAWGRSPDRRFGEIVSGLGLLACAGITGLLARKRRA